MTKRGFTCWLVDAKSRDALLAAVPPEFPQVICHHVTFQYNVPETTELPEEKVGYVVGEIIDCGVQAVVVEIDGNTIRPDGERFHITMSLEEGRYAEEAKRLVRRGWFPLREKIAVRLIPAFEARNL